MKKNFLFSILAIWLAWFWFGGISMADYVASIGDVDVCTANNAPCYTSIAAAISAAKNGDTIKLLKDTTIWSMITLEKDIKLNVNGYKINSENETNSIFQVINDATLTIDWTVTNSAVYWRLNAWMRTNNNGNIILNWGTYAVWSNQTVLHVNWTCKDSNITIKNVNITSTDDNGIQLNGAWTHTIENSTIKWKTAVYLKAGNLTVTNSSLVSTSQSHTDYSYNWNGSNPTWDTIVVDSCAYPGWNPDIVLWEWNTITVQNETNNVQLWYYEANTDKEWWAPGDVSANDESLTLPAGVVWVQDWNVYKIGHTVTFNSDGWSAIEQMKVVAGETVTQPENPSKNNYEFVAWYKENTEFDFDTPILADTTLTAKWWHKVTFDVDGETYAEVLVVDNTQIWDKKPENPTKEWYAFKHWAEVTENEGTETTAFGFDTSITANKTLKAVWVKAIDVDNISFKKLVIWEDNSHKNDTYFTNISTNNEKFDLSYDKENKILTITDKWLTQYQNSTNQSKKWIGVIADFWTEVKWTWTNGDYGVEEADRTDAASWWATTDTEFVMWLSETRDGQIITLKNTWSEYDSVSFKLVFKTLSSENVSFDNLTIKDENPQDSNYENIVANNSKFKPYYDAETNTLTIKDNWLVKYDNWTNYGSNEKAEYKWIWLIADFGAVVEWVEWWNYWIDSIDRADASKWASGDASNTAFVMWLSDHRNGQEITLKKQWEGYSNDSITFKLVFEETVTFESNGWSTVAAQQVIMWKTATKPADPTKSGYTFKWWYSDEDLITAYDFTAAVNDNITLYAKWEQNKSSSSSSGWGGGGGSSKSTTKTTTTTDTEKTTTDTKATDTKSDTNTTVDNNNKGSNNDNYVSTYNPEFSQEFNDAYQFARKNGITTMSNIEEADMYGPLTRVAMAKMLSQYAINVLGQAPDTSKVVPTFSDVDEQLNADYNNWVTLAYQLGIMWIGIENYRPFDLVTRAEFGTALSRMLYGLADGQWDEWYSTHLSKLMNEEIITVDTPNLQELRGYVMIMLMRSAQS